MAVPDIARAKPLKVALITHYFPAHRGGVERVAGELASRLAAAGVAEFTWHASDTDPRPAESRGLHCVAARAWNFSERRLGVPYPIWSPRSLRDVVRTVRSSDVVHLHDCLYLPQLVAFAAARLARRPVLVTQHIGMVPYRNRLLRAALAGSNRILARAVLRRAAQAVFVSAAVLRYFGGFVPFARAPLHLPNGVDTRRFSPADVQERRRARAQLGVPDDTPLLLFVGRFVEKKGLPQLRALAGRLAGMRWVFAGWGPLDPDLWRLPNVSVARGLEGEQLAPLYRAADLLVLPSVGEGFPLVVQEAMACGTPALVGEDTAAGCPEAGELLLREDIGGSDAASRWATRIEALFATPQALQELEALRPKVAEFARRHWSWDRCAERYAELLRACAASG